MLLLLLELPRSWLTVGVTSLLIHSDSFPTHSCTKRNLLDCRLCPLSTKGKSAGYVSVCVCLLCISMCVWTTTAALWWQRGGGCIMLLVAPQAAFFAVASRVSRSLSLSLFLPPLLSHPLFLLSLGGTSSWVFILFPWFFGLRLQLIFISSTVHLLPAQAQAQAWPDAENSY